MTYLCQPNTVSAHHIASHERCMAYSWAAHQLPFVTTQLHFAPLLQDPDTGERTEFGGDWGLDDLYGEEGWCEADEPRRRCDCFLVRAVLVKGAPQHQ